MKKLALATAIAMMAISGTASAVTLYDKDGVKFKIDGDIQIQLRKKTSATADADVDYDDSEIKTKISYDLGNGMTAFAEAHRDNKKNAEEETFVGLKGDGYKVRLGNMDYATDEFGIEKAYEAEVSDGSDAFDKQGENGDIIRADFDLGPAAISLSHDFAGTDTAGDSTDLFVSLPLGEMVELGLAYQTFKANSAATSVDTTGISLALNFDAFDLAFDYSDADRSATVDATVTNIAASFKVAPNTKVAVGLQNQEITTSGVGVEQDVSYANITYKFPKAKKVSVFGEIYDEDAGDTGYLAGLRVKF